MKCLLSIVSTLSLISAIPRYIPENPRLEIRAAAVVAYNSQPVHPIDVNPFVTTFRGSSTHSSNGDSDTQKKGQSGLGRYWRKVRSGFKSKASRISPISTEELKSEEEARSAKLRQQEINGDSRDFSYELGIAGGPKSVLSRQLLLVENSPKLRDIMYSIFHAEVEKFLVVKNADKLQRNPKSVDVPDPREESGKSRYMPIVLLRLKQNEEHLEPSLWQLYDHVSKGKGQEELVVAEYIVSNEPLPDPDGPWKSLESDK